MSTQNVLVKKLNRINCLSFFCCCRIIKKLKKLSAYFEELLKMMKRRTTRTRTSRNMKHKFQYTHRTQFKKYKIEISIPTPMSK